MTTISEMAAGNASDRRGAKYRKHGKISAKLAGSSAPWLLNGYRLCAECGQPMLPAGQKKKLNEYDHAQGCPIDAVNQRLLASKAANKAERISRIKARGGKATRNNPLAAFVVAGEKRDLGGRK